MEVTFKKERKVNKHLTLTHLHQLEAYCRWAEEDGGYYGFKPHFEKRHKEIKAWLEDCIKMLDKT